MTDIRILNGVTSTLVGDQLMVMDFIARSGRRCRAIWRSESRYLRPVCDAWTAVAEAPWGTYFPRSRREAEG